jgi:uncharacterized membrane protein YGL010W
MIPGTVHAALVVVFTYLVQLAFAAIGFTLDNETAMGLATIIVGYILSLVGLGLFNRLYKRTALFLHDDGYNPPFV